MLIEVTQEDIEQGCIADAWNCPLARAVIRRTGVEDVRVTPTYIRTSLWKGSNRTCHQYRSPRSVKRFINRFDNNKSVKPFRFYLIEEETNP